MNKIDSHFPPLSNEILSDTPTLAVDDFPVAPLLLRDQQIEALQKEIETLKVEIDSLRVKLEESKAEERRLLRIIYHGDQQQQPSYFGAYE